MTSKSAVFGTNVGALKSWEHTLDGAELTVASKSAESWHQLRQDYPEAEVTTCNERSANIFWRGTTDLRTYRPENKRDDVIYTPEGLKLYPGWFRDSRTYTYWVSDTENYRFVLSIYRRNVTVTCYYNRKVGDGDKAKWVGILQVFRTGRSYNAGDWQRPESERKAVLWLMKAVSKVAAA